MLKILEKLVTFERFKSILTNPKSSLSPSLSLSFSLAAAAAAVVVVVVVIQQQLTVLDCLQLSH